MARNGSGTYVLPTPANPAVAGTTILASYFNTTMDDLATALSGSLAANGEKTPTANLPMGGFKLTGLGAGTASTDAARLGQLQAETGVYVGTVGGTGDVITLTPSPAITAYAAGQRFTFIAAAANTTNVTVNVSALGAKAITKRGSTALVADDIIANAMYEIFYDGTRFQLIGPLGDVARKSSTETISGSWTISGGMTFSTNPTISNTGPVLNITDTSQAADETRFRILASAKALILRAISDDATTARNILVGTRGTGAAITSIVIGNPFDTPTITMYGADGVNRNVGYMEIPQNVQNGNYTLVLTDNGKSIDKQSGGAGETITIPANASVAFPIGAVICVDNDGGGTLTIAITSDTLEDSAGNTGSRTLADNGSCVLRKIATTKWRITGTGVT